MTPEEEARLIAVWPDLLDALDSLVKTAMARGPDAQVIEALACISYGLHSATRSVVAAKRLAVALRVLDDALREGPP